MCAATRLTASKTTRLCKAGSKNGRFGPRRQPGRSRAFSSLTGLRRTRSSRASNERAHTSAPHSRKSTSSWEFHRYERLEDTTHWSSGSGTNRPQSCRHLPHGECGYRGHHRGDATEVSRRENRFSRLLLQG